MLYTPLQDDTVLMEEDAPLPDTGAPVPLVMGTEDRLLLAYYTETATPEGTLSKLPLIVNQSTEADVAIIEFLRPLSFLLVPLSDEIFDAHPLAARGLAPYRVFRIEKSSWIRRLAAAQYVHARPVGGVFDASKHYVFAFHDSVFECIADAFEIRMRRSSLQEAQEEMVSIMRTPLRRTRGGNFK